MELPDRIEGLLLYDVQNKMQIRIVNEIKGYVRAVEICPTKLKIHYFEAAKLAVDCHKGLYQLVAEESRIVDENVLSVRDKKDYHDRLEIIHALKEALDGDLLEYEKRSKTNVINAVYDSFGVNRSVFRKWLLRYIQSGEQNYSLLNQFKAVNGRAEVLDRNIQQKLGRKSVIEKGKILDEYDYLAFDALLKEYKKNIKSHTFRDCWIEIRQQFYNELTITGKGSARNLVARTEYPTEKQARSYVDKHMTDEEKLLRKYTKKEIRNNMRILNGDTVKDAQGPMAICETDAWDADIILVDGKTKIKIGRPSVYAIIDDYSKAIVTFYVTYNKDNVIGLSSLMMSLMDDKAELKKDRANPDAIWFPGTYLPEVLRTDRGPDFTSNAYESICNRLAINRELVPGAMGSLKPNIERLWGRIDSLLTSHVYAHGQVNYIQGEKPYKNAVLTIEEYTRIVTEAVIAINSMPVLNYPMDAEMIAAGIDLTPRSLWEYGVKKYGEPRSIRNKEQFLFDMMLESTCRVDRSGCLWTGLYYDNPDDKRLQRKRFKAQDKGEKLIVRFDPRSVDHLWYHWEDEATVRRMDLMTETKAGMSSFAGMTYQQYLAYVKEKKNITAEAEYRYDMAKSAAYLSEKKMVDDMAKDSSKKNNSKPTKEALNEAKQTERAENPIADKMDAVTEKVNAPEKEEKTSEETKPKKPLFYANYDEALLHYDDDVDEVLYGG